MKKILHQLKSVVYPIYTFQFSIGDNNHQNAQ